MQSITVRRDCVAFFSSSRSTAKASLHRCGYTYLSFKAYIRSPAKRPNSRVALRASPANITGAAAPHRFNLNVDYPTLASKERWFAVRRDCKKTSAD
jgi:hypothetical protein